MIGGILPTRCQYMPVVWFALKLLAITSPLAAFAAMMVSAAARHRSWHAVRNSVPRMLYSSPCLNYLMADADPPITVQLHVCCMLVCLCCCICNEVAICVLQQHICCAGLEAFCACITCIRHAYSSGPLIAAHLCWQISHRLSGFCD